MALWLQHIYYICIYLHILFALLPIRGFCSSLLSISKWWTVNSFLAFFVQKKSLGDRRYPHLVAIDLGSMGYDGVEGAADCFTRGFFVVDDVDHSLTY